MTNEERRNKVDELMKIAADDKSKTKEVTLQILQFEIDNIKNAINVMTVAELPFIVTALEKTLQLFKSELERYPDLMESYIILKNITKATMITTEIPRSAYDKQRDING